MPKTRNNHYVPQWYQQGFMEPGRNTLAYLDTTPPIRRLEDGRTIIERAFFEAPTSRAFSARDLYSTFFGTLISDEIERRLFGDIDTRGANAVRAFAGTDSGAWHLNFLSLFEYLDCQKIRTPKGLDWLRSQYPNLTQNDLMLEMQGIRMLHCSIWSEAVRELVSAEDADVKFIVSDHPVTVYNHAVPPEGKLCAYPCDPSIALKASQTIFPLNRDLCLILTNLEYASDPATAPLQKRTFARNYRTSMVRTDAFIRTRKLSSLEVARVNFVIKARARRYIAAGQKPWLYPEEAVTESWAELAATLLPSEHEIYRFGGEMFAKFENGDVHYQDAFGRTEKERAFLKKEPLISLRPGDMCGCGNGRVFKACCMGKPSSLRPTWSERSIRERNIMLFNAITHALELGPGKDWTTVRRELTDKRIAEIYHLYAGLWPLETDVLALLPRPDGAARAIYTGVLHPATIKECILGASLYFGELIVQHPFLHAGSMSKKFSPVEHPRAFRHEFLKSVLVFLTLMPLVDLGLVNLIPDPCDFDQHLREQMMHMAKERSATMPIEHSKEPQAQRLMQEDCERGIMALRRDVLRDQLLKATPGLGDDGVEATLRYIDQLKERDPLFDLQDDPLDGGADGDGQFSIMKLVPNFEMAMYLAQVTGACIVTDSAHRWSELNAAIPLGEGVPALAGLAKSVGRTTFAFPQAVSDVAALAGEGTLGSYPKLMRESFKYLSNLKDRGQRPNFEAHLAARFMRTHQPTQAKLAKSGRATKLVRVSCLFPAGGITHNTVNRLLLMSSSEAHLRSAPMALFIEPLLTN